ncbi:tRNA (adenine(37)-N6)-methyltransferase [Nitrincola sp. A-D6]|uniref:tRNA (N6-threonylcarbamoyladenosine(37)-N6)-methyltransferase TrmO n=1 Tax=Nitrincola sp. A-D6 TaxID=1545442 RepID=UPI00051FB5C4|nr:tRNA (N6-threonylcarbamoyladenosine(37)-N6)-methyltransferase TrmO [Nitrincola sp. A-D6]KGK41139.1 tRNA (adenine(37)-N6)-methyltransferase [Nitrincola sp. A-D6]
MFQFDAIGYVHSPFKEKFGIPRQPGLTQSLRTRIHLHAPYNHPDTTKGLADCSHIWIIFVFSATQDQGWHATVRPPRLGGNKRLGVFASRSTFRPNPIGLSVARLIEISSEGDHLILEVADADLLDGTPVLDIKPYLPYADSLPEAHFSLGSKPEPLTLPVLFSTQADAFCQQYQQTQGEPLQEQITELLRCDPRPAYQTDSERIYGMRLHDLNLRWSVSDSAIQVIDILPATA